MYIAQGMKQMPTASIAFSNRSRSSSKCEISVPSASPPGSPSDSLIGRFAVGVRLRLRRRRQPVAIGRRLLVALLHQLLRAHFALELLAELTRNGARPAHPITDLTGHFGKPLR